jgi:hypothetical protein
MFLSIALGVLVIIFVLLRQTTVRPVPRRFQARLPVILGVIGLFELFSYTDNHHVTRDDDLWLVGTLVVGAVILGAVRALTVKVWTSNNWVVRQGTPVTMVLWVISLGLHFVVEGGGGHAGVADLEAASLLLYLGLTLGTQNLVIHRRALALWEQLGPDAGRRLQVNFGTGPGGMSTFFTTFRSGGAGWGNPGPGDARAEDPSIIDAEVVDDEEPPELPRPG